LLVDSGVTEEMIRQWLGEAGIRELDIRPISPSLEDVFVTLTAQHSSEGGKRT
jgi:hypothetical protein